MVKITRHVIVACSFGEKAVHLLLHSSIVKGQFTPQIKSTHFSSVLQCRLIHLDCFGVSREYCGIKKNYSNVCFQKECFTCSVVSSLCRNYYFFGPNYIHQRHHCADRTHAATLLQEKLAN